MNSILAIEPIVLEGDVLGMDCGRDGPDTQYWQEGAFHRANVSGKQVFTREICQLVECVPERVRRGPGF